ncbi:AAA family ATPase [Pseudomonas azerbaijanoccidens]|uniref:AAA family ATPase n=1 Tax=Pseudomonas azerbaijanoccidentalis TaxID=2842347 RepID=UPI00200A07A1|nr:AAA family ATPase [Pseudomonas azerbaijanoccidentalis]MCK8663685.1 AAA family ATPase [Pseudomonas azerbaijanoccidentalis]
MDVRLTGWSSQNIRGGLRDIDIELGPNPKRWTLVQMPNGTGKTTTMELLRATLSGADLTKANVRALRADDSVEHGLFEVRLQVDTKVIRLQLRLNFIESSASYWTARAGERMGGIDEGRNLPADLRLLLKPALTELFVFNGELATQIIDLGKSRAAEAIRALYGLDTIDAVKQRVNALIEQEQRRAASVTAAKEKKGITQLENAFAEAEAAKKRLEDSSKRVLSHISQLSIDRSRLEAQIEARIAEDSELREKLSDIYEKKSETDDNINILSTQALEILRRPSQVHPVLLSRLKNLGGKLYELKLPETISREFFRELSAQDTCVCGRPIGHEERHAISEGAERYLAQDQISVINQMKLALRESSGDADGLSEAISSLQAQLIERRKLSNERDRVASAKIAEGDEILNSQRSELRNCIAEMEKLTASSERLTTKDPLRHKALRATWETNLPLCETELKNRKFRLETATRTRNFALQGDQLKNAITTTVQMALEILRERVRLATNEKLKRINKNEMIEVSKIEGGLVLSSPGLGAKAGASEGQKLAIAYAFLTSLLAEATYKLPFIVDSPAVSLDNAARKEVGEIIPDFFGQMIMFVISSERDGFAESFYKKSADVKYITVTPFKNGNVQITEGLDFFKNFQAPESAL